VSIRQTLQRLRRDDGGQSPWIVMAGVTIFVMMGTGLAIGLTGALTTQASIKHNAALDLANTDAALTFARSGFDNVAAAEGKQDVNVRVGAHTVSVIRVVEVNGTARTARVTYSAPTWDTGAGEYGQAVDCETKTRRCVVATEFVNGATPPVAPPAPPAATEPPATPAETPTAETPTPAPAAG
jgi:hypothetical protein